jgi:ABC-type phosphate/phosphonate transport system substrate-binding protein
MGSDADAVESAADRLAFGLVPPDTFIGHDKINHLLRWIGDRAGKALVRRHVDSYDDLVRLIRARVLQIAWLPPIPFARLEGEGIVRALVCAERGGDDPYVAVLFSKTGSRFAALSDLRGARVGWVDPLSTTGYVVPRMRLAARFPQNPGAPLFASESFFGSHAAVIRALLDGTVDVAASFGGFTDSGELVRGAFLEIGASADDLRVIEAFGAIPPDVIAIHRDIDEGLEEKLATAFEATAREPAMLEIVRTVFGAMFFIKKPLVGYDLLRSEVENGVDSGVIPAAAAFLSTRPPPPSDP